MKMQNDVVPPSSQALAATFVTINEEEAGQRIDNYLLRVCKGVPKSHIYRILRSGEVRVNKGRIDQLYRLVAGDLVRIPPIRIAEKTHTAPVPGAVQGCTVVVIGSGARLRNWIVWNCKDKYWQADPFGQLAG